MRFNFGSLVQAAAFTACLALPQVPDSPLPPGTSPDTPAPSGPPGGAPGPGSGPGGSTMSVDSMTMVGTGCPIGAGGVVQEVREGIPVFSFSEWNLNLAEADPNAPTTAVEKFCQEEMRLSNGPTGMQFRIGTITIEGWADLKTGSKISIATETRLGDTPAVVSNSRLKLLSFLFISPHLVQYLTNSSTHRTGYYDRY
jgi:hypothetical protein